MVLGKYRGRDAYYEQLIAGKAPNQKLLMRTKRQKRYFAWLFYCWPTKQYL